MLFKIRRYVVKPSPATDVFHQDKGIRHGPAPPTKENFNESSAWRGSRKCLQNTKIRINLTNYGLSNISLEVAAEF
ncbi:hypothetical protein GGE65_007978 [Skermanella aerolata]